MDEFLKLFIQETKATITGLTGEEPQIAIKDTTDEKHKSNITPPMAMVYIDVNGAAEGKMIVAMPPQLATALVDMMMAGEGDSKDDMNDEDLDGTKEVVSNITGAIATALASQNSLPKFQFSAQNIAFIKEDEEVKVEDFGQEITFNFKLSAVDSEFMLIVDNTILQAFNGELPAAGEKKQESNSPGHAPKLDAEEMRNINLILDVKLPVTVRIGTKRMLLKDVVNMDIGSVIELNQLANDPLDILVDNNVIAQGEVVIVDGNFGIQITQIGTKRERLNQLKG